jgi:hypothetical protein
MGLSLPFFANPFLGMGTLVREEFGEFKPPGMNMFLPVVGDGDFTEFPGDS